MRIPRLQGIEVEVSEWKPPPTSLPAFRALASELLLYCPTVTRVVFIYEFERTVIAVVDGICRLDSEIDSDVLWREI